MEHILLKARTEVAADAGVFEAVISAGTLDREKDMVDPAGMVRALQRWVPTGKNIPLAWQHSTAADQQIGYIDPKTARQVGNEVVASGWIDQSTDTGQHAWRLVKMGTLGFSFGYLVPDGGSTPRKGGGRMLNELDVFEVTATPTPMHNDTRVLGYKSGAELAAEAERVEREFAESQIPEVDPGPEPEPDPEPEPEPLPEPVPALSQDELKATTRRVAREYESAHLPDVGPLPPAPEPAPEPEPQLAKSVEELAKTVARIEREQEAKSLPAAPPSGDVMLRIPQEEMDGLADGLKAVWSTAYVNTLPDSAFLHIESGGTKDSDGRTVPRTLRHFPYKDDTGAVDLPHLRNALSRIPQAQFLTQAQKDRLTARATQLLESQNKTCEDYLRKAFEEPIDQLSQDTQDRCAALAQQILNRSTKSADRTAKGQSARAVDPLRRLADAVALEFASGGESLRKPPRHKAAPPPQPQLSVSELRQRMRDELLIALSGVPEP